MYGPIEIDDDTYSFIAAAARQLHPLQRGRQLEAAHSSSSFSIAVSRVFLLSQRGPETRQSQECRGALNGNV
jgi:hypothetical protein